MLIRILILFFVSLFFLGINNHLCAEKNISDKVNQGCENAVASQSAPANTNSYQMHFIDVPAVELLRFVSRISGVNFMYNQQEFAFPVTLCSSKRLSGGEIILMLLQVLRIHGISVEEREEGILLSRVKGGNQHDRSDNLDRTFWLPGLSEPIEFDVYKLQYHQGEEIVSTLKNFSADLLTRSGGNQAAILEAIQSIQWVKATNSLFFSGTQESVLQLRKLISTLDVPLKQVFIEVLVIETDAKHSSEFGLQWIGGGHVKDVYVYGSNLNTPSGMNLGKNFHDAPRPIGGSENNGIINKLPFLHRGFDLGVIGDILFHKGDSYISLGALATALATNRDITVVLNQTILTQDNKNSKIFVGDNIPFTGSVISTTGITQQTVANIEYRDVGVKLSLTPMLGENEVITLDIDQEITEAPRERPPSSTEVEGIRTTKTNMATRVHVPNDHFLVISGMVRNARTKHYTGIPCLGGVSCIGSLFGSKANIEEKRYVMIFVHPHIVGSVADYLDLTGKEIDANVLKSVRDRLPENFVDQLQHSALE